MVLPLGLMAEVVRQGSLSWSFDGTVEQQLLQILAILFILIAITSKTVVAKVCKLYADHQQSMGPLGGGQDGFDGIGLYLWVPQFIEALVSQIIHQTLCL